MATRAVERSFQVGLPVAEAWARLADVERWPEWAPHIKRVTVSPPGPLGPSSSGALLLFGFWRDTFRVSAWEPLDRWEWTGGLPGARIVYDHLFQALSSSETQMTWTVTLHGPLARLIRPVFARIYRRVVDRAIPRLQEWIAP